MQAILAHPENTALIKRLIGLEEFVIPEEESRTKQYREIAQLVAEMPVVHRQDVTAAAGPAAAAASPGGVEAEVILPSIMPDEFADNHAVELEICMRWFSSDAGQVAKIEAPFGVHERAGACAVSSGFLAEAASGGDCARDTGTSESPADAGNGTLCES